MTMDWLNALGSMVRVGTVSAADKAKHRARVMFDDLGVTSGWLLVLKHRRPETTLPLWMPEIGEVVLTLYIPVPNGDGFILGGL